MEKFPIIGGPVIAIIAGMVNTLFWNDKGGQEPESKVHFKICFAGGCGFSGVRSQSSGITSNRKSLLILMRYPPPL